MTAKTLLTPAPGWAGGLGGDRWPGRRAGLWVGLLALVLGSATFASGCASTTRSASPSTPQAPAVPPPSEAMLPSEAVGIWQSSFGAVKIEPDTTGSNGRLMGVWLYERAGQEVVGFFAGELRGNVFEFSWHEPSQPADLTGAGYLMFDPAAGRFTGKWWSHDQSRGGDWTGWRPAAPAAASPSPGGDPNS